MYNCYSSSYLLFDVAVLSLFHAVTPTAQVYIIILSIVV